MRHVLSTCSFVLSVSMILVTNVGEHSLRASCTEHGYQCAMAETLPLSSARLGAHNLDRLSWPKYEFDGYTQTRSLCRYTHERVCTFT
mmetsp:Transcript_16072/g.48835  ORF Transcript_16072/g.48835 Transcript_16072/m.48835 type:complete len:88 (+) Transcript_16072:721-984(+)